MRTYRIYFIRHGMTEANVKGRYAGVTDVPLCQQGEEELRRLAAEYEYPNVGRVYTSPLMRCRQTADIVYPEMQKTVIDRIHEMNFGIYEDKTAQELSGEPEFAAWLASNMKQAPEGGENLEQFHDRIQQGMHEIILDMMEHRVSDAAVVTHGGVIMSLLCVCGIPAREATKWIVENGKGYSVLVNASLWDSSRKFEICDPLPYGQEDATLHNAYHFIDVPKETQTGSVE